MPTSQASAAMTRPVALTHFAARAGDHNDRAMVASRVLAAELSDYLGTAPVVIGEPQPAVSANWDEELAVALPSLNLMSARYGATAQRCDRDVSRGEDLLVGHYLLRPPPLPPTHLHVPFVSPIPHTHDGVTNR